MKGHLKTYLKQRYISTLSFSVALTSSFLIWPRKGSDSTTSFTQMMWHWNIRKNRLWMGKVVVYAPNERAGPLPLFLLYISIRILLVFTWQEKQCSGYLTFYYRSVSSDHYLWLTDPDPRIPVPLTNGSDSGSLRQWPSRCQQKIFFLPPSFFLSLFEGTFTSFFTDKMPCRSHKTVEIKGFSYYFCLTM